MLHGDAHYMFIWRFDHGIAKVMTLEEHAHVLHAYFTPMTILNKVDNESHGAPIA